MRGLVMWLSLLGAIGAGGVAFLAMFAQGMSDAPADRTGANEAWGFAFVAVICVVIFLAARNGGGQSHA